MASAAEQLAASINFSTFAKAKELKQRIVFTLLALIVYRLGTYIPVPGVNAQVLADFLHQNAGGLLGIFDAFAGGAISRMAIFSLSVFPYITASIIFTLMTPVSAHLDQLRKEGESGRKKINQYSRYLTIPIAGFQAYAIAIGLESMQGASGHAVLEPGWFFRIGVVMTLLGGTFFLLWLGEQITDRGIGNGVSMLIFAGIVAHLPISIVQLLELGRSGAISDWLILVFLVLAVAVVIFIVFMERAQRRVLIHHPKRQMGNKMYGGDSTHLPLKLNTTGVMPPILASALMAVPLMAINFVGPGSDLPWLSDLTAMLGRGQPLYMAIYAVLIIAFSFFFTAVMFNPAETAENLRRNGAFIPGIRPGTNTALYFDAVLTRLTAVGAIYITAVCLLPELLISQYSIPFYFGGTSLLIVVTVTMDTVAQIHSHLLAHQYEGLIKKSKLKGRGK